MSKVKKSILRFFASVIVLATVITMSPQLIQVTAEAYNAKKDEKIVDSLDESQSDSADPEEPEELLDQEVNIIEEVEELRDKYTKVYLQSDDSYVAITSAEALHYEIEDGVWEDIDNTLSLQKSDDGTPCISNESNNLKVELPIDLDTDEPVVISKDDYEVSFVLKGEVKKAKSKVRNNRAERVHRRKEAKHHAKLERKTSSLNYDEIFTDTDIVYDVRPESIKESIILNKKPRKNVSYIYEITADGLTAKLCDDNSIEFYTESGDLQFFMPAPYMFDSSENGELCFDIDVTLEKRRGKYLLTYKPSSSWLRDKNRVYPVTIDPTVSSSKTTSNVSDAYVLSSYPDGSYGKATALTVGTNPVGTFYSLVKINSLPKVPSNAVITKANLNLYSVNVGTSADSVSVYRLKSGWSENTITYKNMPTHDTAPLVTKPAVNGTTAFDITKAAEDWYIKGSNYGVIFKRPVNIATKSFASSETTNTSAHVPYLQVTYTEVSGLQDKYGYHSVDAGTAGTVHINDATGNLTLTRSDIGFDGNRMPISMDFYYDLSKKDAPCSQYPFPGSLFGYGFKSSFVQAIEYTGTYAFKYYDGTGAVHTLYRSDNINDSNGNMTASTYLANGYYLTIPGDNSVANEKGYARAKLSDGTNYYHFDSHGRLIRMNEIGTSNHAYITPDNSNLPAAPATNKKITEVKDGAGRKYSLVYFVPKDSVIMLLKEVNYYGTGTTILRTVKYTYNSAHQLSEVTYPDGSKVKYTYDSARKLTRITDVDGRYYTVSYTAGASPRVSRISEFSKGGTAGDYQTISYSKNKNTFTNKSGNKEIVTYNNSGITTLIVDEKGEEIYSSDGIVERIPPEEPERDPNATYDSYGNITSYTTKNDGINIKETFTYSSSKNYLASSCDSLGNVVQYEYDENFGTLTSTTDANGNKTNYTYDNMGRIKTVSSGLTTKNTYTYDGDNLKTIVSPSTTYSFAYNEWGEQSSVKIGSTTLVSYGYTNDAERQLSSLTYGNGQSISHTYNSKKQLTGTKFNTDTSNRFNYTYNSDGTMATKVDVKSGILTKFKEDGTVEEWNSAGTTLLHSYTYDDDGNFIEKVGNGTTKSEFYSSEDDFTSGVKIGSTKNETTKDKFEREISNKTFSGSNLLINQSYAYKGNSSATSSHQVSSVNNTYITGSDQYTYEYDKNGNITTIRKNGEVFASYKYDSKNQLTREQIGGQSTYTQYAYDNAGNIRTKLEFDVSGGAPINTIQYGYDNANWRDQLTSYDGKEITYDNAGNPLSYRDMEFTWQGGRQLANVSMPNATISYTYDDEGIRTGKNINGTKVEYFTVDGKITAEKIGDAVTYYRYDENDNPISINYRGIEYYYVRNLQGDIEAILNSSGVAVVSYTYNAWGKILSVTGDMADSLGTENGLLYRGYFYDRETQLYYLQSRYYDPEVGRFINADEQINNSVLGANIYAYCENNPVIYFDPDGYAKIHVIYYNNPGSGFSDQAMNSPYYSKKSKVVTMHSVISIADFEKAWNSMSGTINVLYLYLHGGPGCLYFKGETMSISAINRLASKKVKRIYLFSCHGGAGKEGKNVAWALAKKTGAKVIACSGSVSYSKIAGKYYARKAWDWGIIKTFYYEKRFISWGKVVARSAWGQW